MRVIFDKESRLLRLLSDWKEVAYISFKLSGPMLEVEFPSDWHEEKHAWVRFGIGFPRFGFAFPWKWIVPDNYQCSGPTYGFNFFEDGLHLHWGKSNGRQDDPFTIVQMPWGWRFINHEILSEPETHDYEYTLKSGEVQERKATIYAEERNYWRPWFPLKRTWKSINIDFDDEVGERSGSWKGGTLGCGYDLRPGETPLQSLRRMEKDREM